MEKVKRHPEPEYIKKMMDRANIKNMIGYLVYGTEIYTNDEDYEKRSDNAYAKLEQNTNGDEKLLTSLMEIIANFSDLYAELGFRAGIIYMADVYAGRDKFEKKKGAN